MTYNFDEVIERRGTDSVKWDGVKSVWGRDDLLPMWVADMDFRTPPFVMEALRKRLEHEVLGYTSACEEWYTSICSWLSRRHGWDVTREMLTFVPGIVRGQAFALQCFTNPGDRVMVMTPVYHPFFLVTQRMKREVVYSPLDLKDGQYQIDFERFRKDIQGCKVLILCNPHNPGGRVWTMDELRRIADICMENHTFVISDEIHADLTLPPYKHHPFATVSGLLRRIPSPSWHPAKHSICRDWEVRTPLSSMRTSATVFRSSWKRASSAKGICWPISVRLLPICMVRNGWNSCWTI